MFTKCPRCEGRRRESLGVQVTAPCSACKGQGYVPAVFDREAIARAIAGVEMAGGVFEYEYKQADAVIAVLSGQEEA